MNVWTLQPGEAIRVVKTFQDGGGNTVEAGTILHFESSNFLPYHEGHTVYFKEVTLYLCGLDETGAIAENQNNEFYEPEVPIAAPPPRRVVAVPAPKPPDPPPVVIPKVVAPVVVIPMPHMRFDDMFLELHVIVVQPFQDDLGRSFAEGLELRFLNFNGTDYRFLERNIRLTPGNPILENEANAWLRPLPTLEGLRYAVESIYHDRTPSPELVECGKWLNKPTGAPPQFDSANLPFAEAFVIEGVRHV